MKTKLLAAAICVIALFSVNLAYGRYPESPYVYCGNNPISRIDPDGRDWYSYQEKYMDENGEEQTRIQYTYRDAPLSNKEMKDQRLSWVGITGNTKDGSQYLSLYGARIDNKTANGKTNLTAEMVANIDNAIINSYKADYRNSHQADPMFPESHSGATNMGISMTVTSAMTNQGRNLFYFNYIGGRVRYEATNSRAGAAFSWGDGIVKPNSGYFYNVGTGATAKIEGVTTTSTPVLWIFPTTQAWQNAIDRTNKLLMGRQW